LTAGTLLLANESAIADGKVLTVGAGETFMFDPTAAGSPVVSSAAAAAVPELGMSALLTAAVFGAALYRDVRSRRQKSSPSLLETRI
jgi:hypothetical protein